MLLCLTNDTGLPAVLAAKGHLNNSLNIIKSLALLRNSPALFFVL